jgi:hypothetical protein
MAVEWAGDRRKSAPRGFLSRWAHALGRGRARPASEGHSYRDAIDALGRIQRRYLR